MHIRTLVLTFQSYTYYLMSSQYPLLPVDRACITHQRADWASPINGSNTVPRRVISWPCWESNFGHPVHHSLAIVLTEHLPAQPGSYVLLSNTQKMHHNLNYNWSFVCDWCQRTCFAFLQTHVNRFHTRRWISVIWPLVYDKGPYNKEVITVWKNDDVTDTYCRQFRAWKYIKWHKYQCIFAVFSL